MPAPRSSAKDPAARVRARHQAARLNAKEAAAHHADGNAGFETRKHASVQARGLSARAAPSRQLVAVAEGDSWFDYKPAYLSLGKDLLGHLQTTGRINVYRVSQAGDTIENMVYGTDHHADFSPKTSQLETTLAAVRDKSPDLFLFSGGGNDLAGPELESYLNHAASGLDPPHRFRL